MLAEYPGVKEARGLGGGESRGEGADNEGGSLTPSIHYLDVFIKFLYQIQFTLPVVLPSYLVIADLEEKKYDL